MSDVSVALVAGTVAVVFVPSALVMDTVIAGTSNGPASHATSSATTLDFCGLAGWLGDGRTSNGPNVLPSSGSCSDAPSGTVAMICMVMGAPGCHCLASTVRTTPSWPSLTSCRTRDCAGARSVARPVARGATAGSWANASLLEANAAPLEANAAPLKANAAPLKANAAPLKPNTAPLPPSTMLTTIARDFFIGPSVPRGGGRMW